MTHAEDRQHRLILQRIAHRVMIERGLAPDFPARALAQLDAIDGPATQTGESAQDLRNLLWCSIDNDTSRDLDVGDRVRVQLVHTNVERGFIDFKRLG